MEYIHIYSHWTITRARRSIHHTPRVPIRGRPRLQQQKQDPLRRRRLALGAARQLQGTEPVGVTEGVGVGPQACEEADHSQGVVQAGVWFTRGVGGCR